MRAICTVCLTSSLWSSEYYFETGNNFEALPYAVFPSILLLPLSSGKVIPQHFVYFHFFIV
jgi:hypothetical protein